VSVLLALLSSVLWGTSDFLGGTATRRLPGASVVVVSQFVALLGLLPLAAVTGAFGTPTAYVLPAVLAGLVGTTALGAFYTALATGTMGVVAPIASLGIVLPVAVGLAQGETPRTLQVLGIVVAVAGVVLASGPELAGSAGLRPLLLAAFAAAGFGTVVVLVARASRGETGAVVMTLLTMRLTSVVVLATVLAATRRRTLGVQRCDLVLLAAIGIGDVAANGSYALASRGALLSVVAVLSSLYPVVTVLLARQLHAERLRPVQGVGVGVALAGVVLLAGG
jgi:drug/metabolite transporter (DMT)-like permease